MMPAPLHCGHSQGDLCTPTNASTDKPGFSGSFTCPSTRPVPRHIVHCNPPVPPHAAHGSGSPLSPLRSAGAMTATPAPITRAVCTPNGSASARVVTARPLSFCFLATIFRALPFGRRILRAPDDMVRAVIIAGYCTGTGQQTRTCTSTRPKHETLQASGEILRYAEVGDSLPFHLERWREHSRTKSKQKAKNENEERVEEKTPKTKTNYEYDMLSNP